MRAAVKRAACGLPPGTDYSSNISNRRKRVSGKSREAKRGPESSRPTKNTIIGPISFSIDHNEENVYVPSNATTLFLPVTRKSPGVSARRKGT